jgi:transcriptional regulator of acetoin/glycerol metabolism
LDHKASRRKGGRLGRQKRSRYADCVHRYILTYINGSDRSTFEPVREESMAARGALRHADRVHLAVASDEAAKSALIASWRRSAALRHLDPAERGPPKRLTETGLREARERAGPLVHAAQESLDRLYLAVGDVGCCVLLASQNGVPLERRGAPVDDDTFHDWGLWPGAIWSEESEGTNGIGTCLVERRALTIHRDQHFFSRNTLLSCTTAPIFDHEGALIAALDVSSCRADLTESFVNLIGLAVIDAARRIEAENFRLAFPGARILLAPVADRGPGALIAVNSDDMVVGATRAARLGLGLAESGLLNPLPAADIVGDSKRGAEALAEAERAVVKRALAAMSPRRRKASEFRARPFIASSAAWACAKRPRFRLRSVAIPRHFRGAIRSSPLPRRRRLKEPPSSASHDATR